MGKQLEHFGQQVTKIVKSVKIPPPGPPSLTSDFDPTGLKMGFDPTGIIMECRVCVYFYLYVYELIYEYI